MRPDAVRHPRYGAFWRGGFARTRAYWAAAFLISRSCGGAESSVGLAPAESVRTVPLWGRIETGVTNTRGYAHRFADVTLRATFTRSDDMGVSFWGFHDGDGNGGQTGHVWKLRFMPDQVGTRLFKSSFSDGAIEPIGNDGVEVGVGCADIEIARHRITDIGAGGIRIGHFFSWETDGAGRLTERGLQRKAAMPQGSHSERITVADNEIAHCGRFTPEAAGVFDSPGAIRSSLNSLPSDGAHRVRL